jgi:hypothetical protein
MIKKSGTLTKKGFKKKKSDSIGMMLKVIISLFAKQTIIKTNPPAESSALYKNLINYFHRHLIDL